MPVNQQTDILRIRYFAGARAVGAAWHAAQHRDGRQRQLPFIHRFLRPVAPVWGRQAPFVRAGDPPHCPRKDPFVVSAHSSGAPAPQYVSLAARSAAALPPLTGAQVAGIVVFPLLGAALAGAGMPVGDILRLLAGCGAIGAATIAAAGGGRRLLGSIATLLRAASAGDTGSGK
jgi:hypothetical protein